MSKPTQEQIQIVTDHVIRMINYPRTDLTTKQKERFRKEINNCQYWLMKVGQKKDITDSMIETKLIQAESDCRLSEVKDFIGM